jgi:putative aldouronate transport system substrate-binding protein
MLSVCLPALGDDVTADTPGIGPDAKYAEPVVVSIGMPKPNNQMDEGQSVESNRLLDYIADKTNIQVKYSWLADPGNYDQKVNLAIATGDIPDIMIVQNEKQVQQLVEAGLVEDLTKYYEYGASDHIKGFYKSYGDRAFTTATFDGELMAMPDLTNGYQHAFLWVRQDWMDAVGAQPPRTVDDLIALAKTFIEKDPGHNGPGKTVGFVLDPRIAGNYKEINEFDPIFAAFNSFPQQWVKEEGATSYSYGSITPQTKTALAKVRDMYAAGLIDPGFAVRKQEDANALLLSGKVGIMFGPWYMPDWPLSTAPQTTPGARWVPLVAPVDADGIFKVGRQNPHVSWIVVRKGFAHPEIAIKLQDYYFRASRHLIPEFEKTLPKDYRFQQPLAGMVQYDDALLRDFAALDNAIKTKDTSKLDPEYKMFYEKTVHYMEDPTYFDGWRFYGTRYLGQGAAAQTEGVKLIDNIYPATTPTMELKWANLQTLEQTTFLKIVIGDLPLDDFDKFVADWKSQGGDEITDEVNQAQAKG